MTSPRSQLVDPTTPGYYHCVSRCVRRAWLCGVDDYSGKTYEHRRQWVEDRLVELGGVFAVGVYAYAVMSNHLHVVIRLDPAMAWSWSAEEVASRWTAVFPLRVDGEVDEQAQHEDIQEVADFLQRDAAIADYRSATLLPSCSHDLTAQPSWSTRPRRATTTAFRAAYVARGFAASTPTPGSPASTGASGSRIGSSSSAGCSRSASWLFVLALSFWLVVLARSGPAGRCPVQL